MSWVAVALAGAAVSALVSVFDKTVIHRYARTPLTLPLLIGVMQTGVGLALLAVARVPASATAEPVMWALVSGAVFGLSAQFLMRVLYTREVSRAVPVFQSYPIFTALYASLFLGERLGTLDWLAIVAVVGGAGLLSLRTGAAGHRFSLDKAFALLIVGSAIHGSAHVFGKAAVDELPVPFTHALRSLALGGVFLAFNLRRRPLADALLFVRRRSPALRFVFANEVIIASAGLMLTLWALSLGPAAQVTAVSSVRVLFIVAYSTILALIWRGALGESTTLGAIAVKLGSTALIVGGVTAIALGSG